MKCINDSSDKAVNNAEKHMCSIEPLLCCHERDRKQESAEGKLTSNRADKTARSLTRDPSAYSVQFGFTAQVQGWGILSGGLTFIPPDS